MSGFYCHSWSRSNGICLVSIQASVFKSRTPNVESSPAVIGSVFQQGFRLFLAQCGIRARDGAAIDYSVKEEGFIQNRRQRQSLLLGDRIAPIPCHARYFAPGRFEEYTVYRLICTRTSFRKGCKSAYYSTRPVTTR